MDDEDLSLSSDLSAEQTEALRIAGELIDAGAPVFAAKLCPEVRGETCPIGERYGVHGVAGFHLPNKWQLTVPSRVWLERWQPGDALAVVGGHILDLIDEDPRAGGDTSVAEMKAAGQWPRVFGIAETPSGGRHHVISPTGEPECNGFLPGLDLQSGTPDGRSRAFAFIAPTVKASKVDGSPGMYRWVKPPELDMLAEFAHDDSVEGVRTRVAARRAERAAGKGTPAASSQDDGSPFATPSLAARAASAAGTEGRAFTHEEVHAFLRPSLMDVAGAAIGGIEEATNRAAVALSHFVPAFFSVDEAMALLRRQLAFTAYDEGHPASTWTVEKFRSVLDGRRPVADPWVASIRVSADPGQIGADTGADGVQTPVSAPSDDAVNALIAEMLTLDQVANLPPPRYLIKGLLNLDSEAWLIGAPGSRKSFVTLDMAMAVAGGKAWQGLPVARAEVIMIVAEGSSGLSKRVKAYEKVHGRLPSGVHVLPRPVQAGDMNAWAVLVEAARRILRASDGAGGVRDAFVVLDTQARLTVGLEENSATDMGHYVNAVGMLRRATGACVLSVHHTGRKGGDARGSSAIDGAQDTELKVVKEEGLRGALHVEKQKDLDERAPMPLIFRSVVIGADEDGDDVTSLVLEADSWRIAEEEARAGLSGQEGEAWQAPAESTVDLIVKVLRDHAGNRGLTQSETRGVVVERFFGNIKDRLQRKTWHSAWTRAIDRELITNVGGERFSADEIVIGEYRTQSGADGGSPFSP